jgi:alkylhydroperoxidase family enzyme
MIDVSKDQVLAVLNSKPREPLEALGAKLSAVLAYTDAMTLDVRVPDGVFDKLKEAGFSEKEIVEITATVAAYNCVSRFLVALDVGERNAQTGPKEGGKE